ncbi:MAG: hypothetical protein HZB70_03330 [Candidatus Berkelbacteria bacterium]|nr:MAG: hypothetical protein HZB70_03330 [Candidatus Berkelbacteria bacterium]QQG51666.1 MAG: hypothetical protein HY845_03860 [Candidatus Berkelbacteria bacterium]
MPNPISLVIVPTAGLEKILGQVIPDDNGHRRIKVGAELLRNKKAGGIIFFGGKTAGKGWAEVYAERFRLLYPDLVNEIVMTNASGTNSAADVKFLANYLDKSGIGKDATLFTPTYSWHFWRIRSSMWWKGYRQVVHCPSNEERCYPVALELLLAAVTLVDPYWQWLGLPLAWLSAKRLAAHTPS